MSKLSWTPNPVTGQLTASFNAKLLNVGETIIKNSNNTEYVIATIEMPSGKQVSGRMYVKNAQKVTPETINQSVLCTATQYDGGIDITVSHLTSAPRVTLADFEQEFGKIKAPAAVATN